MFKPQTLRQAARAASRTYLPASSSRTTAQNLPRQVRWISSTPNRSSEGSKDDPFRSATTAAKESEKEPHEGSFSRTDREVSFEYPDEENFPRSHIMQGRGGMHLRRTLPSFSLEGKVAVVTGGARGLGLVMGQACVLSGADLAIVDMNSKAPLPNSPASTKHMLTASQRKKATARPQKWWRTSRKRTRAPKNTTARNFQVERNPASFAHPRSRRITPTSRIRIQCTQRSRTS
jgi:hypothetical protein